MSTADPHNYGYGDSRRESLVTDTYVSHHQAPAALSRALLVSPSREDRSYLTTERDNNYLVLFHPSHQQLETHVRPLAQLWTFYTICPLT